MKTSRRKLLQHGVSLAAAAAWVPMLPAAKGVEITDLLVSQRLTADLQTHAAFGPKFSGGPGDNATARWTAERLRSLGYKVEESEFPAPFFVKHTTELRIGTTSVEVYAQGPVTVTSADGIRAGLAAIEEDGKVGDVKGRIAVIVAPFARHAALFPDRGLGATVREASKAGALAIIIVTTGPTGEVVALNCPDAAPFVPVPLAILAPSLAAPVLAAARTNAVATLVLYGTATPKPCKNIVAKLSRGPKWIAMSTPRSGWFDCVAERGTGQAAFLEIAAWLVRAFPQHSVFLMNTGAHEYFFAGSRRVINQAPSPANTALWVHIGATLAARDAEVVDGKLQMLDTVDPDRSSMATAKARTAVEVSFAGLVGLDKPGLIRAQAGELSTFTDRGYDKAFACIGQHRWFHTASDNIDCVDASLLLPVVKAHQAAIELLVTG